jgi:DNA-binding response OmpR family regulator
MSATPQRVLIVEDEQHLAEGLRFNLEAEGYQAQVVETGEAALQRLVSAREAFDLVVLDVMLPGRTASRWSPSSGPRSSSCPS